MTKFKGFISISVIVALIGVILLFFNVSFGMSLADRLIPSEGGMDMETYMAVANGYMNNFRIAGGILLGSGLMGIMICYVKRNKKRLF